MKTIYASIVAALLLLTMAAATEQPNEGFNNECQNFYNGNDDYYPIQKWAYNDIEGNYLMDEQNPIYAYIKMDITGDLHEANWTSNQVFYAALVKTGSNRTEFRFDWTNNGLAINGKWVGTVTGEQDISHITFCGKKSNGNNRGSTDNGHGVPEFPAFAMGIAILVGTLGIVVLRKN